MSNGTITMSRLGSMGRFANQVIQYMFLKTYAQEHGLTVQTPAWCGQTLFGASDSEIDRDLPLFEELFDKDRGRCVIPQLDEHLRDVNVSGYFQYHSSYYHPHQKLIQKLFRPLPALRDQLQPGIDRLRQLGKTVVALHIRRGDYGIEYFYRTPCSWYLELLDELWDRFDSPVLFIASDEPRAVTREFASYSPVTAGDLGMKLPAAPFFPDFHVLTNADVLVMPNSSFSFSAAMLNQNLQQCWRSKLSDPLGSPPFQQIDPWNADFLDTSARVQDFPGIAGISRPPKRRWYNQLFSRKAA
ncbi:MAG: alpha-1,2-fucosyltransferase [Rubripirellula sp.]|nr:alpha-1,2-fucosyltransferase [Rubripirellula sp.]